MPSILATYYRGLRMSEVCKTCRGSSEATLFRYRCPLCKKNRADYYKAGLEREVAEFRYLHDTWLKVKKFSQPTTGIKKLDSLIELLFGKPHDRYWRDYAKYPVRDASPYVVLRTVTVDFENVLCEAETKA